MVNTDEEVWGLAQGVITLSLTIISQAIKGVSCDKNTWQASLHRPVCTGFHFNPFVAVS
jgi:hypothetical protein